MGMSGYHDELGDRMKGYERALNDKYLLPPYPIYARIDGRGFSKFTRGFDKPYDPNMSYSMKHVTEQLVTKTHATIGYTQSDEISLLWANDDPLKEPLFGGKLHKLTSVLAAMATAHFIDIISRTMDPELIRKVPHFDCRLCQLPTKEEATNMVYWRFIDAWKNSISMATRTYYSHKEMHGKDQLAMLKMLKYKKIDFDSYPAYFKYGTFIRREKYQEVIPEETRRKIPVRNRPDPGTLVIRSRAVEVPIGDFSRVQNRQDVIFNGALAEMKKVEPDVFM